MWELRLMNKNGFTLLELIMALVIITIVAAVAIPAFSRWLPNYHLRSAARDVYSNFQLAKLTAIKRNTTCAITFGQGIPIGGTTYDYVLYVDADSDVCYDAGEEVIATVLLADRYDDAAFDTTQGGGDGVSFPNNTDGLPSVGFLSNGLASPMGGDVFLTNPNGRQATVNVSSAGNITLQ
jgi:type IV fimbrial biogenesis protein FimT